MQTEPALALVQSGGRISVPAAFRVHLRFRFLLPKQARNRHKNAMSIPG
jgi:hypothetical protein